MKFLMVADFRHNMQNYLVNNEVIYNDHLTSDNTKDIIKSICSLGYDCEYFGGISELISAINDGQQFPKTYFLNFTDGLEQSYSRVQAPVLMELLDVLYSGSSTFPAALMNNKQHTKLAVHDININIPLSIAIKNIANLNRRKLREFQYPLFIKPNCEGSSIGISNNNICFTYSDVENKAFKLLKDFDEILIEEYISGQDVTDFIIGNQGSYIINDVVLSELHTAGEYVVYGIEEKRAKKRDLYWNTEKLPTLLVDEIKAISIKVFECLGASDIIRIDYRIQKETNKIYFIEANSMPRFSRTSEVGFICQKRNISFEAILNYYIQTFLKRIHD